MAGVIIVGPETQPLPFTEATYFVETKKDWEDDWEHNLDLQPLACSRHTAAQDLDILTLQPYLYGASVMEQWDTALAQRDPIDLRGWWIRVKMLGAESDHILWTGRIHSQKRGIQGDSNGKQGSQMWIALGPLQILRKIEVHHAHYAGGKEVGWVPPMNLRGGHHQLIGNRATGADLYGGTEVWNHFEYLTYLLENFVNQSNEPVWTIGGQKDLLENLQSYVPIVGGMTADQITRMLIPQHYGLDYYINETDDGFEIVVFALTNVEKSFGDYDLPVNPRRTRMDISSALDVMQCSVEESSIVKYDKLRVVGNRIKSVFSLSFDDATLEEFWTSALETSYKAGTGTGGDDGRDHDIARTADRFRHVYRSFRAVDSWDWNLGDAAPILDLEGQFETGGADTQDIDRFTLPFLVLREGFDYTQDPPVDNNPSDMEPNFLPPLVIVQHSASARYVPVDRLGVLASGYGQDIGGMGVSILDNEWGVQLHSIQGHALALNHWSGANATEFDPDDRGEDYDTLFVTLCAETDQRLEIGVDLPSALQAGDGSIKTIHVNDAEFWWLAATTVVDVNADGTPLRSPDNGVELRNDSDILARTMAGAMARYLQERIHAACKFRKLLPVQKLLGTILETIEEKGDKQNIAAPITSVSWDFAERSTSVKTGHAQ